MQKFIERVFHLIRSCCFHLWFAFFFFLPCSPLPQPPVLAYSSGFVQAADFHPDKPQWDTVFTVSKYRMQTLKCNVHKTIFLRQLLNKNPSIIKWYENSYALLFYLGFFLRKEERGKSNKLWRKQSFCHQFTFSYSGKRKIGKRENLEDISLLFPLFLTTKWLK